jgi:hypothetical protein
VETSRIPRAPQDCFEQSSTLRWGRPEPETGCCSDTFITGLSTALLSALPMTCWNLIKIWVQSLTKITPNGQIMEGTNTPKEVLEYVVVEKKKSNGAESPWFVWGTTTETLGITRIQVSVESQRTC